MHNDHVTFSYTSRLPLFLYDISFTPMKSTHHFRLSLSWVTELKLKYASSLSLETLSWENHWVGKIQKAVAGRYRWSRGKTTRWRRSRDPQLPCSTNHMATTTTANQWSSPLLVTPPRHVGYIQVPKQTGVVPVIGGLSAEIERRARKHEPHVRLQAWGRWLRKRFTG